MNKELVSFLQTLGDSHLLLDTIRQNLLKTPKFEIASLFKQISSIKNKSIDLKDLHSYLLKKGLQTSQGEIFSIFKELDIKKKGSISFNDFVQYFSKDGQLFTPFNFGEIDLVKKYFGQMVQNHRSLEKLKIKMAYTPAIELFKQISKKQTTIKLSLLKHCLVEQDVPPSTIENLLNYFKRRGQNSLTLQYFISLVSPYSQIKTVTSLPSRLNDLLHLRQNIQIKPALLERLYSDVPATNLQDFFRLKKVQNKSKRQFIQSHEKSRKQLMLNIMQRQNSPKLSIDFNNHHDLLNKSQSLPYMKLSSPKQSTMELKYHLSSLSPKAQIIDSPLKQQNKRQQRIQAIKNAYAKLQKQITQNNLQQFSFNPIQKTTNMNNLTNLLRKQQQQLEHERTRRIELQNQVLGYKRSEQYEQNRHSFKPIQKTNIDTSFLKYTKNQSPIFRQYAKSINSNRRTRQAGKIQHRVGLWPKQYLPKRCQKQNIQQQLRKNRLQRQFSKYKINKQSEQSKYLWK